MNADEEVEPVISDASSNKIGCLKSVLVHLFGIVLFCWVSYWVVEGKKGILVGLGAYLSFLSGKLFLNIFGRAQKR